MEKDNVVSVNNHIDNRLDNRFEPRTYWEKRIKENWGLHGVGYMGYGVHFNRWMYKVREKVFLDSLKALGIDFKDKKVLDIGSGTGFYLDLWRTLGAKVIVGSDITSIAVEQLKKTYPELAIIQADISDLSIAQKFDNKFDVITAFDVLFHIVDDEKFRDAILNIHSLLAPGGYFIFSDNFPHGKTVRNIHQVSRSKEEIYGILKGAKFNIIKRSPMFYLMNAPVDTEKKWAVIMWRLMMLPVRMINLLGAVYGCILFPIEIALIKFMKEGPSTEIIICQKT